ncbi:MAG: ribbon-helix-helix domain-containing protein [Parvibaculales bacterium]
MSDKPEKRSISIAGHATSISLEARFWTALREIAKAQEKGVADLIAEIDALPREASLSSAIRVYVLNWYRGEPH